MFGIKIIQVAAGTVIEHQGKRLTVDDNNYVSKGNTIYVTAKGFDAIKLASIPGPPPTASF